ncbi:MAG: NrfD/PsrC family molybdoenzyme membrane anchor subunit [Syntrophobacteraceae bacterium]
MELTITGANALTHPALNIWNWMVSLYLFLVASAAGLLVMSAVTVLPRQNVDLEQKKDTLGAAMVVPVLLVLGMLTIWLELEGRQNSHWFFLSVAFSSPMFWGGWGLNLALPASILYALSLMADEHRERLKFDFLKALSRGLTSHTRTLAGICCGLGIFLGLYTGVSLSVFAARPLWNSAVAPLLFLVSALTTGAALVIILSRKKSVRLLFSKALVWLIGAEIITIFLFFLGQLTSSTAKRRAVLPFFSFTQDYFLFEISFALTGILLPLALVLKFLRVKEDRLEQLSRMALLRMKLSACLVLAGSMIMRLGWVYLGQLSKLS